MLFSREPMTTSRKQPGVAFWATVVVVVVLVAYPLSFGPACWIASQQPVEGSGGLTGWAIIVPELPKVYRPIGWACMRCPNTVSPLMTWYARIGMPQRRSVLLRLSDGNDALRIR